MRWIWTTGMLGMLAVALLAWRPAWGEAGAPIVVVLAIEPVGLKMPPATIDRLTVFVTGRLAATGKYQVVPREQVKARLGEMKKDSYKECYAQSCQIALGQALAAQKTVATQIVKVGSKCEVIVNFYDLTVEASEGGGSARGRCDEDGIVASMDDAVAQIVDHFVQSTPRPPLVRQGSQTGTRKVGGVAAENGKLMVEGVAETSSNGPAGMTWVTILGGTFSMGPNERGDKEQLHSVVMKTFEMTKTEVTFGQYGKCVTAGKCTAPHVSDGTCLLDNGSSWKRGTLSSSFQGDEQPVVCVDWTQAVAFATWAGARLPTEAEWEYAALSGGKKQKYPWGDETATCSRAVVSDGGNGCGRNAAWPVCSKTAGNTSQGLCDMAGNVWEWAQDWYHSSYAGAPKDGSAWENPEGSSRVVRGGSWSSEASHVKAWYRYGDKPTFRRDGLGFRLARSSR